MSIAPKQPHEAAPARIPRQTTPAKIRYIMGDGSHHDDLGGQRNESHGDLDTTQHTGQPGSIECTGRRHTEIIKQGRRDGRPHDLDEPGDDKQHRGRGEQSGHGVHGVVTLTKAAPAPWPSLGSSPLTKQDGITKYRGGRQANAPTCSLIAQNRRRTWMLMAAFAALLALLSMAVSIVLGGGIVAVVFGLVISAGIAFSSYWSSASLAIRSTRPKPAPRGVRASPQPGRGSVDRCWHPETEKVYVVHDPAPGAFATGRNVDNAAVAVTTGLMDKKNRAELEGVIAHEVAHIRNGDILVMTVAVATAGAIAIISDIFFRMLYWGALTGGGASHRRRSGNNNSAAGIQVAIVVGAMIFVAVIAPLAAALLKAAVSRSRESLADATAVEITRYPGGIRSALEKLDADIHPVLKRTSHATSHLWIESPDDHEADDRGRRFNDMFSTHPPLSRSASTCSRETRKGSRPTRARTRSSPKRCEQCRTIARALSPWRPPSNLPGTVHSSKTAAASSVDLEAVFAGVGGVAENDGDPDHARAGWYADPSGTPATLRYWNGSNWTDHYHQIPGDNDLRDPEAQGRGRRRRGFGSR